MRLILIPILSICIITGFAQSNSIADSLVKNICQSVQSGTETNDSIRLVNSLKSNFSILANKFSNQEIDSIVRLVYYRLQRNCPSFKLLLDKVTPQKGDWKQISTLPNSLATPQDCKDFKSLKSFRYKEVSGDTTNLEIDNGFWIDHFNDGTYSKLTLLWLSENSFKITFVESNNESRMNYSRVGDNYYYYIINKESDYFTMCVKPENTDQYYLFRLYFR